MGETLAAVQDVFRVVFDDSALAITRDTSAGGIEGWDSLRHVALIVNIEGTFGVKFSSSEVLSFTNVGRLVDSIDDKRR